MAGNNQLSIVTIVLLIVFFLILVIWNIVLTTHIDSGHHSSSVSFGHCDSTNNPETMLHIHNRCYNYNDDLVPLAKLPDPDDAVAGRGRSTTSRLLVGNLKTNALTVDLQPGDTTSICTFCPLVLPASPDGEGVWIRTTILPVFTDSVGFGQSGNIPLYELEAETS